MSRKTTKKKNSGDKGLKEIAVDRIIRLSGRFVNCKGLVVVLIINWKETVLENFKNTRERFSRLLFSELLTDDSIQVLKAECRILSVITRQKVMKYSYIEHGDYLLHVGLQILNDCNGNHQIPIKY